MVLANTAENFGDYIDSTVPYNHNIIARIKVKVKTVVNQNSETNSKMWSFSASVIGEHMVGLGQSIYCRLIYVSSGLEAFPARLLLLVMACDNTVIGIPDESTAHL